MTPLQARWDLAPTAEAVHDTRHIIAAVLDSWHVTEDLRHRALLVFAELASNALRHGDGKPITAQVTLGEEELTVDVTDGDYRVGHVHAPRRTGWEAETGRGLLLVAALTDKWGTYPTPNGKGVWATVPIQAEREDHPPSRILTAS